MLPPIGFIILVFLLIPILYPCVIVFEIVSGKLFPITFTPSYDCGPGYFGTFCIDVGHGPVWVITTAILSAIALLFLIKRPKGRRAVFITALIGYLIGIYLGTLIFLIITPMILL